jgi:hypothetical protein
VTSSLAPADLCKEGSRFALPHGGTHRRNGLPLPHYREARKWWNGRGVYKAQDTRYDQYVALKISIRGPCRDRYALERFRREAKSASALNLPNIYTIHDIGEENGKAFSAMEHLDGMTLKHLGASELSDEDGCRDE